MTATTAAPAKTSFATAALMVAQRAILKFARTPQLVVVATVQGALFLLIFRFVFGGAIGTGGLPYVDFLVPGFITTGALFSGAAAAAAVAEDLEQGFLDRLRSLPISRLAVPTGRVLADTATMAWGTVVTTAVGFVVGFRLHGSLTEALFAFVLLIVFGFAWSWMFVTMGLVSGNAQAAQGMSMMVIPLVFVSSAFVPVDSMPGWMRPFAEHQPITPMVNAIRSLTEGSGAERIIGHGAHTDVIAALVWSAVLVAVFAPITVSRYRRG